MKKVLIVGADGFLGKSLISRANDNLVCCMATSRRHGAELFYDPLEHLDISLKNVDAVIYCISISSFVACEQQPSLSRAINVEVPVSIARKCDQANICFIYPSSSSVFSGLRPFNDEKMPADPQTTYGKQKYEAERELLKIKCAKIVRLTKIIESSEPVFRAVNLIGKNKAAELFGDLTCCPLSIDDACDAIYKIVKHHPDGQLFQLSGDKDMDYYSLIKSWMIDRKLQKNLLSRVSCEGIANVDKKMNFSSLVNSDFFIKLDLPKYSSEKAVYKFADCVYFQSKI